MHLAQSRVDCECAQRIFEAPFEQHATVVSSIGETVILPEQKDSKQWNEQLVSHPSESNITPVKDAPPPLPNRGEDISACSLPLSARSRSGLRENIRADQSLYQIKKEQNGTLEHSEIDSDLLSPPYAYEYHSEVPLDS